MKRNNSMKNAGVPVAVKGAPQAREIRCTHRRLRKVHKAIVEMESARLEDNPLYVPMTRLQRDSAARKLL